MRPREAAYDAGSLESLKHRVRTLDERKIALQNDLRTSRTDQLMLRQDIQRMRKDIAQVIAKHGSADLNAKLNAAEERMNSLNREASNFRSEIDGLVKKIDKTREISRNADIEVEMLRMRFAKTLPHVAGEVFLPPSMSPSKPVPMPVPRVRPLSGRSRPLSAFDGTSDSPADFEARLGLYGLKKTLARAIGRRVKEVLGSWPQVKKENARINGGKGEIVYRADEISFFREFLAKRGGFVELFERGHSTEKFSVSEFSDIVALTGYPRNPRTLSACLAVGAIVFKSRVIKQLNLDDPRLRPLPNFNFKLDDASGHPDHELSISGSKSRTLEVLKKHSLQVARAKTAPTASTASKRREEPPQVLHHHVHVVLPSGGSGGGLTGTQLKRVLAEISKSITNNLPVV